MDRAAVGQVAADMDRMAVGLPAAMPATRGTAVRGGGTVRANRVALPAMAKPNRATLPASARRRVGLRALASRRVGLLALARRSPAKARQFLAMVRHRLTLVAGRTMVMPPPAMRTPAAQT